MVSDAENIEQMCFFSHTCTYILQYIAIEVLDAIPIFLGKHPIQQSIETPLEDLEEGMQGALFPMQQELFEYLKAAQRKHLTLSLGNLFLHTVICVKQQKNRNPSETHNNPKFAHKHIAILH